MRCPAAAGPLHLRDLAIHVPTRGLREIAVGIGQGLEAAALIGGQHAVEIEELRLAAAGVAEREQAGHRIISQGRLLEEAAIVDAADQVEIAGVDAVLDEHDVVVGAVGLAEVRLFVGDPAVAVDGDGGVAGAVGPTAGVAPGDAEAAAGQLGLVERDDAVEIAHGVFTDSPDEMTAGVRVGRDQSWAARAARVGDHRRVRRHARPSGVIVDDRHRGRVRRADRVPGAGAEGDDHGFGRLFLEEVFDGRDGDGAARIAGADRDAGADADVVAAAGRGAGDREIDRDVAGRAVREGKREGAGVWRPGRGGVGIGRDDAHARIGATRVEMRRLHDTAAAAAARRRGQEAGNAARRRQRLVPGPGRHIRKDRPGVEGGAAGGERGRSGLSGNRGGSAEADRRAAAAAGVVGRCVAGASVGRLRAGGFRSRIGQVRVGRTQRIGCQLVGKRRQLESGNERIGERRLGFRWFCRDDFRLVRRFFLVGRVANRVRARRLVRIEILTYAGGVYQLDFRSVEGRAVLHGEPVKLGKDGGGHRISSLRVGDRLEASRDPGSHAGLRGRLALLQQFQVQARTQQLLANAARRPAEATLLDRFDPTKGAFHDDDSRLGEPFRR